MMMHKTTTTTGINVISITKLNRMIAVTAERMGFPEAAIPKLKRVDSETMRTLNSAIEELIWQVLDQQQGKLRYNVFVGDPSEPDAKKFVFRIRGDEVTTTYKYKRPAERQAERNDEQNMLRKRERNVKKQAKVEKHRPF